MQKFTGTSIETAFKTISKTISCRPSKLMKKKSKNIPFAFLSFSPQNRQFRKIKETFVVVSILFEIDSPPPPSITRFYPLHGLLNVTLSRAKDTRFPRDARGSRVSRLFERRHRANQQLGCGILGPESYGRDGPTFVHAPRNVTSWNIMSGVKRRWKMAHRDAFVTRSSLMTRKQRPFHVHVGTQISPFSNHLHLVISRSFFSISLSLSLRFFFSLF